MLVAVDDDGVAFSLRDLDGHDFGGKPAAPASTDIIEADAISHAAAERANKAGARAVVLPCVPFGIDHTQQNQAANGRPVRIVDRGSNPIAGLL